jgi:hypothetical protein
LGIIKQSLSQIKKINNLLKQSFSRIKRRHIVMIK